MQEHTPSYEDTSSNHTEERNLIDIETEANGIHTFIDDEMSEPELMFFCKDDVEASALLTKCIKWSKDENWTLMKTYLNTVHSDNDNDNNIIQQQQQQQPSGVVINEQLFIKHFYLGICNFRVNDYQEALVHFIEAQKIHQYYQLQYNIALCYMKIGNLENAVFYLEGAIKKNKHFFFAQYNLIKIYLKKNNTNDAFLIYRDFSEIIKKEKDKAQFQSHTGIDSGNRMSVVSYNTLKLFYKIGAECLFAKQLYQECVYTILDALKFNPEDAEIWCLYAKVFIMKKTFDYAIPLLNKAIDIQPDYKEAKRLLELLVAQNVK